MTAILNTQQSASAEDLERCDTLLWPDYENEERFLGLPADMPSSHSRFPIEPCPGYGELSFTPAVRQNGVAEDQPAITDAGRKAWRRVMQQALGHLVDIPLVGKP